MRLRQGQVLKIGGLNPGVLAVVRADGTVIGLAIAEGDSLRPLRLTQTRPSG